MTDLSSLLPHASEIVRLASESNLRIATAESCTGGLIIGTLTEIAGSSSAMDRGFITYSNEAKIAMLGVSAELIADVGAVSREVAIAMAEGALRHSPADISVAVTGIAGPGGGSVEKPVGLVHFGAMRRGREVRHLAHRFGDIGRSGIRLATVREALKMISGLI